MRKALLVMTLTAAAMTAGGSVAFAQGYGQGYGPGMMGGYGFGIVHLVFWAVILIALVVGIVWLVRSMTGSGAHHHPSKRSAGLEVLEERYARGELNRDEYLEKKKDMQG